MLYHVFQGWSLCSLMSFPLTFRLAVWLWPHWPLGCSSDMLLQNSTSDICWVNKWGWVWKSEKQGIADKPTVVPLSSYTDPRELAETRFQERCSAEQWNSPKALGPWSPQSLSSASAFLLFKQKHYLPPPHTWRTQAYLPPLHTWYTQKYYLLLPHTWQHRGPSLTYDPSSHTGIEYLYRNFLLGMKCCPLRLSSSPDPLCYVFLNLLLSALCLFSWLLGACMCRMFRTSWEWGVQRERVFSRKISKINCSYVKLDYILELQNGNHKTSQMLLVFSTGIKKGRGKIPQHLWR